MRAVARLVRRGDAQRHGQGQRVHVERPHGVECFVAGPGFVRAHIEANDNFSDCQREPFIHSPSPLGCWAAASSPPPFISSPSCAATSRPRRKCLAWPTPHSRRSQSLRASYRALRCAHIFCLGYLYESGCCPFFADHSFTHCNLPRIGGRVQRHTASDCARERRGVHEQAHPYA